MSRLNVRKNEKPIKGAITFYRNCGYKIICFDQIS